MKRIHALHAEGGLKSGACYRFLGRKAKRPRLAWKHSDAVVIKLAADSHRLDADVKRRTGAGQADTESTARIRFDARGDFRILQRKFFGFAEEVFVLDALATALKSEAHLGLGRLRRELGKWP